MYHIIHMYILGYRRTLGNQGVGYHDGSIIICVPPLGSCTYYMHVWRNKFYVGMIVLDIHIYI